MNELAPARPSRHRSLSRLIRPEEEVGLGAFSAALFFGAWLVPVTLLVGIFGLGLASYSSPIASLPLLQVQNLTAEVVQEVERKPAPEVVAPAAPGIPPRAFDPLSAYHNLEVMNNATDGFFRMLWEEKSARLWLEVAADDLGSEFVVSAMVGKGDGTVALLHQPHTASERNVFKFEDSPHVEGTLDLIAPQYELRVPPANGTISKEMLASAAWPGYVRTFEGTKVYGWATRPNASSARYQAVVADGTCDIVLWRNASDPVIRPTEGCEPYSLNQTSWLIDVTTWLVSGAGVLSSPLSGGRLVSAKAFPANAEVAVQTTDLEIRLSIAKLPPPSQLPIARVADDRVGYWNLHYTEVGSSATGELSERTTNRKVDVIHRWRLEPADPSIDVAEEVAAERLVVPHKPITFYIDPSVPERWRAAMRRGVEAWLPAFEQAGWRDAIRAVLPGEPDWPEDYSAADMRYASISWAISMDRVYAVGPHTYDPRTGEILDADIMFAHSWIDAWISGFEAESGGAGVSDMISRGHGHVRDGLHTIAQHATQDAAGAGRLERRLRQSQRQVDAALGELSDSHSSYPDGHEIVPHSDDYVSPEAHGHRHGHDAHPGPCGLAAASQAREAIGILRAKLQLDGVIGEGDPVPEEYVEAGLVEVTMHEVGHTLGLRHNFRASAAYSFAQLSDPTFTAEHGFASSVMDYVGAFLPSNRSFAVIGSEDAAVDVTVARAHEAQAGRSVKPVTAHGYNPFASGVGVYDRHAIEYGYKVFSGEVSGRPLEQLATLAARGSTERELAFATDEDGPRTDGVDPHTSLYDMSDDPIGFHADSLALAQQLLASAAQRAVLDGESWTRLLPSVQHYMRAALRAGTYSAKYIGGFSFSKAHKGDTGATSVSQAVVKPVPAAEQWRALRLILQIISDDFWVPATRALRSLPKRTGWCKGLDRYCYGVGPAELLAQVQETRVLLLHTLVQPHRLAGLQQAEWEGLEAAGDGVTDAPAEAQSAWEVAWLRPPVPLTLPSFAASTPSTGSLLRAIHSVVSGASGASLLMPASSSAVVAAETKARHSVERVWVSILADMSDGTGEAAAVATSLLRELGRTVSSQLGEGAPQHSVEQADALEALAHMLSRWERGLPVPV